MITIESKWHYLSVKILSALLKGITLNNSGDYCFINCLLKNKFKLHETVYKNYNCEED